MNEKEMNLMASIAIGLQLLLKATSNPENIIQHEDAIKKLEENRRPFGPFPHVYNP